MFSLLWVPVVDEMRSLDPVTNLIQITMEDLQIVEHVCRTDPGVIEQCAISGIPKEDMHKVYCDRECNQQC